MKNLKFTLLSALVLIAFTASSRAEFLYVSYGPGLLSFSINPNTGALTKLPDTPTLFPGGSGALTLARSGHLLYMGGESIHGYRIKGNGQLQPLPGSPYRVPGGYLAVDPFNRFLYATNFNTTYLAPGTISVYRIEPNGSLRAVPGSPFPTGSAPWQIAVDPFGRFVYVANLDGRDTTVYRVLENGALTQVTGSPYAASDPITVAADPLGRFVYVANENDPIMYSYRVGSNGSLSQLPGSPTPTSGAWIENMAIDPFGRYLYQLEGVSGFGVYRISNVTGLPERIQDIGIGNIDDNNPVGVAVSPTGKFVYEGNANGIVDPGPMTLRGFQVGPGGILTLVPGSPYYPLGNNGPTSFEDPDPSVVATEGYPSSMVVAP